MPRLLLPNARLLGLDRKRQTRTEKIPLWNRYFIVDRQILDSIDSACVATPHGISEKALLVKLCVKNRHIEDNITRRNIIACQQDVFALLFPVVVTTLAQVWQVVSDLCEGYSWYLVRLRAGKTEYLKVRHLFCAWVLIWRRACSPGTWAMSLCNLQLIQLRLSFQNLKP